MSLVELRRILGATTGVAVCCGMAVGAGILTTPGGIAKALPSEPWIYAVWCLGALVATLDAFILAEMAAMVPRVGGLVAYVRLSFGPAAAFLVGWSMLLVTWPASLAFVAVATGELMTGGAATLVAEGSTGAGRAVAVAVIATVGCINMVGLRFGARFEIALVALKMALLGGVCIAAAVAAPASALAETALPFPATPGALLATLGGVMAAVIFTYDGYADAVYMAGETRDPGRALPRALFIALLSITGLYLLANATFLRVLGVERLAESRFPALDMAELAFGAAGSRILTVIAVIVLVATVNGYFLTGPRIARILAEEGVAPQALGRMRESGAPLLGTVWMIVVSSAFALTNNYKELLEKTVPIISATTALVAIGLLVQRARAPRRPRPFRVRLAWLVVGLQVLIGFLLLAAFVANSPMALAIDAVALTLGLVVYRFVRRRGKPAADRADGTTRG